MLPDRARRRGSWNEKSLTLLVLVEMVMMEPLINKLVGLGPCGVGTLCPTNHCSVGGVVNISGGWDVAASNVKGPPK